MPRSLNYRGRSFSVGDRLVVLRDMEGGKEGLCKGDVVTIAVIEQQGSDIQIGLRNSRPMSSWHNLGGALPNKRGWWVHIKHVYEHTAKADENLTVDGGFSFKGRSLDGMKCKRLFQLDSDTSMVEFVKEVGGGGADGFGRRGRCVVVPNKNLKIAGK